MRKTALILALILTVCAFNVTCFADEGAADVQTVETLQLSVENLNFLTGLGILGDARDKFTDLSAPATRAHSAYLAAKLTVSALTSTQQIFGDVESSHWAFNAVNTAANCGIVSKADNFEPDGIVTLEQADKMFVCALGYTPRAESLGGYPVGYVQTANRLKLNQDVVSSGTLKIYDLLQMAANAAETDVMLVQSMGESFEYRSENGLTPLTEVYDIHKTEGVVTSNGRTALTQPDLGSDIIVVIGGTEYNAGSSNVAGFLGQKVSAYYKDVKGAADRIVYVVSDDTNKIVNIVSADLGSYSGNTLTYYVDGKKKTLHTSPALTVIYNEQTLIDYTNNHILVNNGEVTFIDNDGNGVYDVALSYAYSTYYVSSVNKEAKTVIDEVSDKQNTRILNLDPLDVTVRIFDSTGKIAAFDTIVPDTVITVFESVDGKYVDVYTGYTTVEGKITTVNNSGTNTILTVDDKNYTVDVVCPSEIILDAQAVLYINSYGKVAVIKYSASEKQIGFLIAYGKDGGIETNRKMKVVGSDGESVTLYFADKARVNDVKLTDTNESLIWNSAYEKTVNRRPVFYKVNEENEVTDIYPAEFEYDADIADDLSREIRMIHHDTSVSSYYSSDDAAFNSMEATANGLYPNTYTSGSVVYFAVPTDSSATDEDYTLYDMSTHNNGLPLGKVDLYAAKDSKLVTVAAVKYSIDESNIDWSSDGVTLAVLGDFRTILDEKDREVTATSNILDGRQLNIGNYTKTKNLHPGDMILYTYNTANKQISQAMKLYDAEKDTGLVVKDGARGRYGLRGTIIGYTENTYYLETAAGDIMPFRPNVLLADLRDDEVKKCTSADLAVGQEICIYYTEASVKCIVIIK